MYLKLKYIIEKILSLFVLLLFLPLIIIVLIIAAIETRNFPIIKQSRMLALDQKTISIYKIRTIKFSSEFESLEKNSTSIFNKSEYQEFVPPFCCLIRKSGFDEILQLVNVLKGEMTLIGPRPFLEADLKILNQYSHTLHIKRSNLTSKPGITGYWQLWKEKDKNEKNLIELDSFYDNNKSLLLDLRILFKTIKIMISFNHSDAILEKRENIKLV